jgi:hypothetical protein
MAATSAAPPSLPAGFVGRSRITVHVAARVGVGSLA